MNAGLPGRAELLPLPSAYTRKGSDFTYKLGEPVSGPWENDPFPEEKV